VNRRSAMRAEPWIAGKRLAAGGAGGARIGAGHLVHRFRFLMVRSGAIRRGDAENRDLAQVA